MSSKTELRFGSRGSVSIDLEKGTYYDHEIEDGGGVVDFVRNRQRLDKDGAIAWLQERGHLPKAHGVSRQVEAYNYVDTYNKILFQVVRFEPKNFTQRAADGQGGFIWKKGAMNGVPRVIYRLPQVLRAIDQQQTIYICEGEKGVHSLETIGLVGTCSPGGAGKWRSHYNETFIGADVVLLPDNDPQSTDKDGNLLWHPDGRPRFAGQDHADDVAQHISGYAKRVRWLMLPGLPLKGDIADWIAGGGTAEALSNLAEQTPEWVRETPDPEPPQPKPPQWDDDEPGYKASQEESVKQETKKRRKEQPSRIEWPEPLDFLSDPDMTGAPELTGEHIPAAIAPFVFDTAARMGVDPAAVALAAIVSLASVISEHWRLQPKQNDYTWTEAPRIWGAIVGSPSMLKSPIIRATTAPIDKMEAEARERHDDDMRAYRGKMKKWKDGGSDPTAEPKAPRLDRWLVEGSTTEAISEVLRDDCRASQRAPAGKILIRQDEMSEWVASFDRYRSGGKGGTDRGAYLRLFNGGRYTIDRVHRGTFAIPNWSACILGGIQPGPIRQIAKDAADDGLLQRFLYCVPHHQGRGEDRKPDHAAQERYAALFPALANFHPSTGAAAGPVVLHTEAHPPRLAIQDLVEALAAWPDASDRRKSALMKWPGLWARLVLIFHLIEQADAKANNRNAKDVANVARGAATTATKYMREILLPHLLRAEAVMFASEQTGHARWIAGFILSKGENRIAARDIIRAYGALRAPEQRREMVAVMESLETMSWVRPEMEMDNRAPVAWHINPKVHSQFAERARRERLHREAVKERIRETLSRNRKP